MRGTQGYKAVIADGVGNITTDQVRWYGGQGTAFVYGTLDGASVQLEASLDGSNWMSLESDGLFTAAAARDFRAAPCFLRAEIAGGTAPAITVVIRAYSDA